MALSVVHAAGYIYNNLRLRHVLLDTDGHVKLTDFSNMRLMQGSHRGWANQSGG